MLELIVIVINLYKIGFRNNFFVAVGFSEKILDQRRMDHPSIPTAENLR